MRVWVGLLALALLASSGLVERASAKDGERRPPPRASRVDAARPEVFRQLEAAHEALAASDAAAALAALRRARQMPELSPYETSLIWQLYGYAHAEEGRYDEARAAFERSLAAGALTDSQQHELRYNLGQLYVAAGQYEQGIELLQAWLETADNPPPAAYFLIASAFLQLEQHEAALEWAESGLARTEEPREAWLVLALSLYFEAERLEACASVLERLVSRFPEKPYWKQLSAVYGELQRDDAQLAVYALAHRQGLLRTSSERVRLAQLFMYNEVPVGAANLLRQGLETGGIERTAENWALLANARIQARELQRAVEPLEQAARLAKDGPSWLRLAQLHVELEDWAKARRALESALHLGGLREPAKARLLLGIALYHEQSLAESRRAFALASRDAGTRSAAEQWLRYLDRPTRDR